MWGQNDDTMGKEGNICVLYAALCGKQYMVKIMFASKQYHESWYDDDDDDNDDDDDDDEDGEL